MPTSTHNLIGWIIGIIGLENNLSGESAPLTTQFVLIKVELSTGGIALRNHIEAQLRAYGEPLRWAITAVDKTTVQVEAVVTLVGQTQL